MDGRDGVRALLFPRSRRLIGGAGTDTFGPMLVASDVAQAPPPGAVRMPELVAHRIGLFCLEGRFHALADRSPHSGGLLCSSSEVVTAVEVRDGELATGLAKRAGLRVRRDAVRIEGDELIVGIWSPP